MTYLIHLGYLAYDQDKERAFIPNEEVRMELIKAVKRRKWDEMIQFQQSSMKLLEETLDMNEKGVAAEIEKIHSDYTSVIQYNDENSLCSVLTIAYLSSMSYYFKPVRELPTGRGFADFVYIPKPYVNAPSCHINLLELSRYARKKGKKLADLSQDEVNQFLI